MARTSGRWGIVVFGAVTLVTVGVASYVRAEGGLTLEERVERLERRAEMPAPAAEPYDDSSLQARLDALEGHIKNLPFGLKLGGMVVTSYLYDLNQPDSNRASIRSLDGDHNTFSLDLFQLQVSREPNEYGVGFFTKVNFGKVAERMASDWDGSGTIGDTSEESNSIELQDAYITWAPPSVDGLSFKAGKFVTLIGAEVIESPLNYNISRSIAFGFAIPFTHTGALATYQVSPIVSLTGGVVNGWDNVIDSNDGKSFLGSIGITPMDEFWVTLNGIYGAEQPDRGDSKRGLVDLVANWQPIDNLTFNLNYDYGNETELGPANDTTVEWNAFSGIVAYDMPEMFVIPVGFALRGEYFDDSDGTRLGGDGYQNAWEVTTTLKLVLAEGLMFRTEYRYDAARHNLFERDNSRVGGDDQHTVAAELSYVF
jgi:Putative beta-barrel porin-2, OmpL-like. bbp2